MSALRRTGVSALRGGVSGMDRSRAGLDGQQ